MKKTEHLIFYTGMAGIVLLLLLMLAHAISWKMLILLFPLAVSLSITGITLILLQSASGFARYLGIFCAISGLATLFAGTAWTGMHDTWAIGFAFSIIGLILGVLTHMAAAGKFFRWAGSVSAALLACFAAGIACGASSTQFHLWAVITLALFSLLALASSVLRH